MVVDGLNVAKGPRMLSKPHMQHICTLPGCKLEPTELHAQRNSLTELMSVFSINEADQAIHVSTYMTSPTLLIV